MYMATSSSVEFTGNDSNEPLLEGVPSVSGWSHFFSHISLFLRTCGRQYRVANESFAEYAIERLTVITSGVRNLLQIVEEANRPELNEIQQNLIDLEHSLHSTSNIWVEYYNGADFQQNSSWYVPPLERRQGVRGRQRFVITKQQLEYLRSLSFTWVSISKMLMVSRMTVYRRRVEYDMLQEPSLNISDDDLESLVQRTIEQHPCVGQSFIWGVIRSEGYRVTRDRVRRTIRQCDPINSVLRWGTVITPRQPYSVPGPNSLWHIDGNHKLIRWKIVCHGCIDGYSRMVVFLKCSTNNRSTTVYELFLKAVDRFGLPSRMRSDYGGENYLVARHMIRYRGEGRGSMLTGSSTHNQRIERLWVDMYRSVTIIYYRLFYYLEQQNMLDVLNEVHIFALHFIYIPRINQSLLTFQNGWNNHGIRTANHLSPKQLFLRGTLHLHSSGLVAVDFLENVNNFYGVSENDPLPIDELLSVSVPESRLSLQPQQLQQLQEEVNPLSESDEFGIDLYQSAIQCLRSLGHT